MGGKKVKDRLTLLVRISMAKEKLPFLMINSLFLRYQVIAPGVLSQCLAWMTGELVKWNIKLSCKNRHVLLVIGNCLAHRHDLKLSYINIKFLL